MVRLSKSVSTAIQLWKSINIRSPLDGEHTFSETSIQTSFTRHEELEGICNLQAVYMEGAANILNKQPRANDKGWSSSLGVWRGANNPSS
jgi:hypothetical protein